MGGSKIGLIGMGLGLAAAGLALTMLVNQLSVLQSEQANVICEEGETTPDGDVVQGEVTSQAEDEIPADMLEIYQDVAEEWDMDWALLAAVGFQESTHGTDPNTETENHAGALGPMQFIPVAWEAHGLHYGDKDGEEGTPPLGDRTDPETAVWSAAHKLTDQGANDQPEQALVRYYGADTDGYVDSVMGKADNYRDGDFSSGTSGEIVLASDDCPEEGTGIPGEAPNYSAEDLAQQSHLEACEVPGGSPFATGNITPLTCAAHKNFVDNFGDNLTNGGNCFRDSGPGEHPKGRACDYMTSPGGTMSTGSQEELGDTIAEYALTNAEDLGVMYVIWKQRIWNVQLGNTDWRTMEDRGSITENHYDHVHVSMIE